MRAVLTVIVLGLAACGGAAARGPIPGVSTPRAADATPAGNSPADRIARVECGLLPRVEIEGETEARSILDRMRAHKVPGLSIAVIEDFRVVWAKGYGLADPETGDVVDATTLFQAGSISKPVSAFAVLLEAAAGRLSLDQNVNELLRGWRLPENDLTRGAPVTLRRLLSHTAGTTVHGFPGYAAGDPLPTLQQVLDGEAPANTPAVRVDLAPGSRFRYSGGGTTIAQQVLIDAEGGRAFPEILRERVLRPLGMEHSTYVQPLPALRAEHAAAGHDPLGAVVDGKRHVYPEMAAAGLWTTAGDLARFLVAFQLAIDGRDSPVPPDIAKTMTTGVTSFGGGEVAMGFFLPKVSGATYFGHDGVDEGFDAMAIARKGKGYGLVMMANANGAFELFREIRRAVAREYAWEGFGPTTVKRAQLDPSRLAALAGRYAFGVDRAFVVSARGDSLEVKRPLFDAEELVPVGGDAFVAKESGDRFEFSSADVTVTPEGGAREKATRVPDEAVFPMLVLDAGRVADAIALYQKMQSARADDPAIAEDRFAQLYDRLIREQHDVARALLLGGVIVNLYPSSADAHLALGDAYAHRGSGAEAVTQYLAAKKCLAADRRMPDNIKAAMLSAIKRKGQKLGVLF